MTVVCLVDGQGNEVRTYFPQGDLLVDQSGNIMANRHGAYRTVEREATPLEQWLSGGLKVPLDCLNRVNR